MNDAILPLLTMLAVEKDGTDAESIAEVTILGERRRMIYDPEAIAELSAITRSHEFTMDQKIQHCRDFAAEHCWTAVAEKWIAKIKVMANTAYCHIENEKIRKETEYLSCLILDTIDDSRKRADAYQQTAKLLTFAAELCWAADSEEWAAKTKAILNTVYSRIENEDIRKETKRLSNLILDTIKDLEKIADAYQQAANLFTAEADRARAL